MESPDTEWQDGVIDCLPPDPDAGGMVCITFDVPGLRRKIIGIPPGDFPPDAPLTLAQPLQWRFIGGVPEFKFPERIEVSEEQLAASRLRASDIAAAGGATLLTDADIQGI